MAGHVQLPTVEAVVEVWMNQTAAYSGPTERYDTEMEIREFLRPLTPIGRVAVTGNTLPVLMEQVLQRATAEPGVFVKKDTGFHAAAKALVNAGKVTLRPSAGGRGFHVYLTPVAVEDVGSDVANYFKWVACNRHTSPTVSLTRHLISRGAHADTTLCGTTGFGDVWRGNYTKPKCEACLARLAEIKEANRG